METNIQLGQSHCFAYVMYVYSRYLSQDDPTEFTKSIPWPMLLINRDIVLRVNTRIRKSCINHKLANVFEILMIKYIAQINIL